MMQGDKYELHYRSGQEHQNADCLSRLLYEVNVMDSPIPEECVHLVEKLNQRPVTAIELEQWTKLTPCVQS